jgi:L-threonylcarbamoyladenylate synthase
MGRVTRDVEAAAAVLRAGGVVAFPTETVYGLGADALNATAVRRVFAIKRRPVDHPLIVHLADGAGVDDWALEIGADARRLAARFWPGPLTLILRRHPRVPDVVTGGQDSVGLRVPDHPMALALLRLAGGAAAPSANRFGRVSPTSPEHVRAELGDEVDLVLDGGPCRVGIESTILSLVTGEPILLRPGNVTPRALAEVLGRPVRAADPGAGPVVRAPGSLPAHYAPTTPMRVLDGARLWEAAEAAIRGGRRVGVIHRGPRPPRAPDAAAGLPIAATPEGYARELYAVLRRADALGRDELLVEAPPEGEAWQAVRDRLSRAAVGSTPTSP